MLFGVAFLANVCGLKYTLVYFVPYKPVLWGRVTPKHIF